jgi:hypothetical protein
MKTKEELIREVSGTHVVLVARCPGKPDVTLFESGNERESRTLCDTAILLLSGGKEDK